MRLTDIFQPLSSICGKMLIKIIYRKGIFMNTALVTGSSSGIGAAICRMLLKDGYQICGIGRDFDKVSDLTKNTNFFPFSFDLTDSKHLISNLFELKKNYSFSLLINCAGVGYFGPHEELNPRKIHELVTVNLEIPMLLTNLFLRQLKQNQGTIVMISSVTAQKTNTHGCAYGATKAGLSNFSSSLFEEVRKYGVRVITLHPDITKSEFYRNSNFKEGQSFDTYLFPEEIAQVLHTALNFRTGALLREITIQPQKHQIQRKSTD